MLGPQQNPSLLAKRKHAFIGSQYRAFLTRFLTTSLTRLTTCFMAVKRLFFFYLFFLNTISVHLGIGLHVALSVKSKLLYIVLV
jgi:hypothetical protein